MSEVEFGSPGELRAAAREVACDILLGVEDENASLPELTGHWPDAWVEKGKRYSVASPFIKRLANYMIEGYGCEAVFKQRAELGEIAEVARGLNDAGGLLTTRVRQLFGLAHSDFWKAHSANAHLMDEFTRLSDESTAHTPILFRGESVAAVGADFPAGIGDYVLALDELVWRHPDLSESSPEARRDLAHGLLPIAIGREASMHVIDFIASKTLRDLHTLSGVTLRPSNKPEGYSLGIVSGLQVAKVKVGDHNTPSLACPAHWQLKGEPETALTTFIHAGINLAYDDDLFGDGRLRPVRSS